MGIIYLVLIYIWIVCIGFIGKKFYVFGSISAQDIINISIGLIACSILSFVAVFSVNLRIKHEEIAINKIQNYHKTINYINQNESFFKQYFLAIFLTYMGFLIIESSPYNNKYGLSYWILCYSGYLIVILSYNFISILNGFSYEEEPKNKFPSFQNIELDNILEEKPQKKKFDFHVPPQDE